MADQFIYPNSPGKIGGADRVDGQDMKSEAACQTIDYGGSIATFTDTSFSDMFTSLTEMKMSLHKVEAQNRKLKESRTQMQSQLEASEKNCSACKEKLHKTAEQLSMVFQENCRLNEENARLRIENQNWMKQVEVYKKKFTEQLELMNTKPPRDYCDTCPKQRAAVGASPIQANLELRPELSRSMPDDLKQSGSTPVNSPAIKKLKGLEKRHSSPQFFPNNESVEEISEKLLAQLMQEKRELEQQYDQMVEIQRVSDGHSSNHLVSDFSLLELDCPEDEDLIKEVENCSRRMLEVKQNVVLMKCNLKFILHYLILQKQEGNSPKSISSNAETKQQMTNQSDSKSITPVPRTLIDSLESNADTPSVSRREGPTTIVPPGRRRTTDDNTPWNSVHPPPLSPVPSSNGGVQHRAVTSNTVYRPTTNPQEHEWHKPLPDSGYMTTSKDVLSENTRTCWPPSAGFGNGGGGVSVAQKQSTKALVFAPSGSPLVQRSESAEANAGSPPPSLGLTPDSLLPSGHLQCDGQLFSRSPELSSKEEDRICPMCAAVFPCPVPQDQFETHVVNHFELEEFELLNI